ncbi:MAG: GNAT family N-acetyltransferase [Clostridiales Family XIII bacterium]|jgi:GNAT superfamily N-acetyltransferase|nr:GNAT family N-acetyltransferase [Clostridiales Family XIII bacterium]
MIQITPITKNNLRPFEPLLPRAAARKDIRLGCVYGDTAVGAAQLRRLPGGCKLTWLYVAPDFRGCGCGAALLRAAARAFSRTGDATLSVFYDARSESAAVFDALFLRAGFELFAEYEDVYRVPWDAVQNAPFFRERGAARDGAGHMNGVMALRRVSAYHMEAFRRLRFDAGDFLCAEADYGGADKDAGCVCLSKNGVEGVFLLSPYGDGLWIDALYAKQPQVLRGLFLHAFRALQNAERRPDAILFSGDETARSLAVRLLGPVESRTVEYHRGSLRSALCASEREER